MSAQEILGYPVNSFAESEAEPLLIKFRKNDALFGVRRGHVRALASSLGATESDIVHLGIRLVLERQQDAKPAVGSNVFAGMTLAEGRENNIAGRLFTLRKFLRFSQSDMADALEVSLRSYRNYEGDLREAPASALANASRAIGIACEWLLMGGTPAPSTIPPEGLVDVDLLTRCIIKSREQFAEWGITGSTEQHSRFIANQYAIQEIVDLALKTTKPCAA